jgi:hypothetical protein
LRAQASSAFTDRLLLPPRWSCTQDRAECGHAQTEHTRARGVGGARCGRPHLAAQPPLDGVRTGAHPVAGVLRQQHHKLLAIGAEQQVRLGAPRRRPDAAAQSRRNAHTTQRQHTVGHTHAARQLHPTCAVCVRSGPLKDRRQGVCTTSLSPHPMLHDVSGKRRLDVSVPTMRLATATMKTQLSWRAVPTRHGHHMCPAACAVGVGWPATKRLPRCCCALCAASAGSRHDTRHARCCTRRTAG